MHTTPLSSLNSNLLLKKPLKRRGRPSSTGTRPRKQRKTSRAYNDSNLSQLYKEGRLTLTQFRAGETFLWIVQEVRKNIPAPTLAQNKYREKIQGLTMPEFENNEGRLQIHFSWWQKSIAVLIAAGGTTKSLIEDFIWNNNRHSSSLSEVELQLIKRGLDHLALIYQ